jgi:hypothetical protein
VVCSSDAPGLRPPLRFIIFLILEFSFWPGLFALPSSYEGRVGVSGSKPGFYLDAVIVLVPSFNSFQPLMEPFSPLVKGAIWGPSKGSASTSISLSGCGPDPCVGLPHSPLRKRFFRGAP